MTPRIRVLIADDSAFARKVLRDVLSSSDEIEVVGVARDGLEALEKVAELAPDVLTLDLVMPNLDGLGVLAELPAQGAPRVVVVSISDAETELGAAALQAGAIGLVKKPTALATQQLYDLKVELLASIRAAASARHAHYPELGPALASVSPTPRHRVLVLGTSTGGPQAITRLLQALPASLPLPMAIALHIPDGYTEALALRLNASSALEVREARSGMLLRPGLCILARGGAHLRVMASAEGPCVGLDYLRGAAAHAPSVDQLFESAVAQFGAATLGVVLTGMGDDGLRGAAAIRRAGGTVLAEAEQSCVVYGMPRCVTEAGLASAEAPLEAMATTILEHL